MADAHEFETEIELTGRTATFFKIPLDVRAVFGRARPPVRATIGGHTYRSTVASYGNDYFLPLNKANRAAAGVAAGDRVTVRLELDDAPREVDVPPDLAEALGEPPGTRARWDAMSFSHQREYAEWIAEAKKPETRARRVAKAAKRIAEGLPQR